MIVAVKLGQERQSLAFGDGDGLVSVCVFCDFTSTTG
jgi:hypothetical protein